MAEERDFMRSVLPVHDSFHPEDSSLALPLADKLTLADAHRLNRLQQQVQLTLSRKKRKPKPADSSPAESLSSCQISSSSSLGNLHLKRTFSINHEATRSLRMVDRSQWPSMEPPVFHRGYGSFRYTPNRAGLFWGSNSLTLPSAPTTSHFHMNKLPLRYAHSEVLRNPRFAGKSLVTQIPSSPVYENHHTDDTDDVFLPSASVERSRMESEKHTLQRTLCKQREGGFVGLEQSENVSWQSRVRKPSLEFVAGRRPSQTGSLISMEEQSGSLGRIEKLEVKQHAVTTLTKKGKPGELSAEMTLKEAVNLLTQDNNMETQITAANFIQNQCFNSPDAKRKILYLQGIPKLLKLMQNDSEELQRAAVSSLRNIVFENNENKMEVRDCEGLPVILRLLKINRDIETRRQLTGLLWNLSSHDLLKEQLSREAVRPLTDSVLVPCSGISEGEDPKLELLADPDIFYNATGCLRNLSSAGPDGRKAMRDCEGLIECVIYYIRGTIADYKPDDKATENCVCILHNLSYRFDCEVPRVDSPVAQKPKQTHTETSNPGCFIIKTPKSSAEDLEADADYPLLEENGSPHGVEWLWSAITVRMYLSLIAVSTNQHTKQASIGTLQNLTACSGEISQAIAHFIVQKEGGLSQVKKLLQEAETEELRTAVSLLKNISRYRELHADIVKQALPELVAILPNSDRNVEQPIEITVTICHILINLSQASVSNTCAIINQGALPKIISISTKDNGFGPTRAGQAACVLLHTLWRHSELHSSFKKAGYRKTDFINNRTVKAVNSARE
ncbi:plakophilin-2 [Danio aesculapii]|uniref:plakophilin-2 n=1 Tax=Danio aesculapii TaxID=1142201 RepID=UPI0024C07849|nr:plakophilin-2 [Danio aesculapii]